MTKKMDEGGPRLSKGRAVSECISWPKQQLSCDRVSTLRWPKHSRERSCSTIAGPGHRSHREKDTPTSLPRDSESDSTHVIPRQCMSRRGWRISAM